MYTHTHTNIMNPHTHTAMHSHHTCTQCNALTTHTHTALTHTHTHTHYHTESLWLDQCKCGYIKSHVSWMQNRLLSQAQIRTHLLFFVLFFPSGGCNLSKEQFLLHLHQNLWKLSSTLRQQVQTFMYKYNDIIHTDMYTNTH